MINYNDDFNEPDITDAVYMDNTFDEVDTMDIKFHVTTNDYVDFLNGKFLVNGNSYDDIIKYDNDDIKNDTTFYKWMFPITSKYAIDQNFPVVNIKALQQHIANNSTIQDKLVCSLNMMMKYWGLDTGDVTKIIKLNGYDGTILCRILQSLVYHGLDKLALETYNTVSKFKNYDNFMMSYDKNSNHILNPVTYYSKNQKTIDSFDEYDDKPCQEYVNNMDIWKYHLLKACKELNNLKK